VGLANHRKIGRGACDALATACSAENPTGLYATGAPSAKVFNHILYRGPNGHLFEGFQATL
jgi:hypothetical protein